MHSKKVLAFDLGASSGRAVTGVFEKDRLTLNELHRFENKPVEENGTLYWDIDRLMAEIKTGISKARDAQLIGVDTWGVDFGLIGKNGELLEKPVHYRDARTDGIMEEALRLLPRAELYARTGVQLLKFNTIFQLYYLATRRPELLAAAHKLLLMPDLIVYLLTGRLAAEYTVASTTQLLDAGTRDWAWPIIDRLGIPRRLFCEIVPPGTAAGTLTEQVCGETGAPPVPVCYVAGHDTASAVIAVPAAQKDFAYISSGTWSLLGTELDELLITDKAAELNFTNEGGYGSKIRLLKNVMGLWILQECRRQWSLEAPGLSFAELEGEARKAPPFKCLIDPDDEAFIAPDNMPEKIILYCEKTNQPAPRSRGEITRCVYESLALKYRHTLEALQALTGRTYRRLHIVGGGAKDALLSQMTADACNLEVVCGPSEATATGNLAAAAISAGILADLTQARQMISDSFDLARYAPENPRAWEAPYSFFETLISR